MRADEYLMAQSLLDKLGPGMTSSEKSNRRGERGKEVAQWWVAQTLGGGGQGRGREIHEQPELLLSLKHLTLAEAFVENFDTLQHPPFISCL